MPFLLAAYGARIQKSKENQRVSGPLHHDHGIQRKLLSEGDLSYKDALALAQSIESAEDDAKKLGGTAPPQLGTVHHTQTSKPSLPSPPTCYRCGGPHLAPQCRHKDTETGRTPSLGLLSTELGKPPPPATGGTRRSARGPGELAADRPAPRSRVGLGLLLSDSGRHNTERHGVLPAVCTEADPKTKPTENFTRQLRSIRQLLLPSGSRLNDNSPPPNPAIQIARRGFYRPYCVCQALHGASGLDHLVVSRIRASLR